MRTSSLTPAAATILCLLICHPTVAGKPTVPVSNQEAAQWLRWVSPLPKHISITAKRKLPLSAISVRVPEKAGPIERLAAEQLRRLLQQEGTKEPAIGDIDIVLGVCDEQGRLEGRAIPGSAGLAKLPNKEQAYVIASLDNGGMALTGLDPRGVRYAAQTFGQLLKANIADGCTEVPVVGVTDWPDLAERGLWGWNENRMDHMDGQDLDWFAGLKFNHLEIMAKLNVERGKPATAAIDTQAVERCRLRAIKMMPVVRHLEQLGDSTGIFQAYPETRARGKFPEWASVLCYSQPATQRVLDEWYTSLARTVGTRRPDGVVFGECRLLHVREVQTD